MHRKRLVATAAMVLSVVAFATAVEAAPYASGVELNGTTVTFVLNEPADSLTYSINGGAPVALDGTTNGQKSFTLGSPSDTFSIVAEKNAATGFTIPTGAIVPSVPLSISQDSPEAGFSVISDDSNPLVLFPNPRGVGVSRDPNASNFGTAYIANGAEGLAGETRTVGDGLYAIRADGADPYGYGDTAQNPTNIDTFASFSNASSNSPYKLMVGDRGNVYVADWSDVNANAFEVSPDLQTSANLLFGFGGPAPPVDDGGNPTTPTGTGLPASQYHGSIPDLYVEGTLADNNLVLYAIDEDLNSAHVSGVTTDPKNDRNSIWRFDIGGTPDNPNPPTDRYDTGLIGGFAAGGITTSMDRGADGKFYVTQNRFDGNQPGLLVRDTDGTELFNSLTATRDLLSDPQAVDIFRQTFAVAVSPDQEWLAVITNISDIVVMPMTDGIPDIAARMVVNTTPDVNSGRDIAFDAAGNIHYVSSGQGLYRVLAPGGHTIATTSWDGSLFDFDLEKVPSAGLTGDYNGDGKVDAADYVVWRRDDNSQQGYDDWRANFGAMAPGAGGGSANAVPEPGTLALVTLGALALTICRRRHGQQ